MLTGPDIVPFPTPSGVHLTLLNFYLVPFVDSTGCLIFDYGSRVVALEGEGKSFENETGKVIPHFNQVLRVILWGTCHVVYLSATTLSKQR